MHAFSCTYCVTKHARLNYIIQLWIGILNEITSMFLTVVLAAIEMDHLHTYSSQFSSRYITKLPYGWTLLNHTLKTKAEGLGSFTKDVAGFLSAFKSWATWTKEIFRTCNVLPFSCTHLALWTPTPGKVKDPRYMQNKKDSKISLTWTKFLRQNMT